MDITAQRNRGCWTGIHILDHPLLLVHHVHHDHNDTKIRVDITQRSALWACLQPNPMDQRRDGVWWSLHGNRGQG